MRSYCGGRINAEKGGVLAHREVSDVVGDVLDRVGDDHDAHVDEVGRGHLEHAGGEGLAVAVDLFHGHVAHDGALFN